MEQRYASTLARNQGRVSKRHLGKTLDFPSKEESLIC